MALTTHSHQSHARAGPAAPGPSGAGAAGTAAGVSASLIWGSAFLVPVLLGGWNPVIVTLGRYLVYGLLSAILFTLGGAGPRRVLREHWRTALAFALAGNAAYYLLLVIGVRAAGAPLTDMVIGAIPVVVAVAGNVLIPAADAVPWWRLALPLTLVIAGLVLVGALEIAGVHAYLAVPAAEKAAGLLAACAAVVLWTWYALANARFLGRQRAVSPAAWSTAVGVATGAVALAGLPVAALAGQLTTPPGAHPGPARLVAGVVFLGVVVSWAGTWLWNLASSRLSPVVAGLLVNLETVSGFGYVYAARQQWPAAGQLTGLALVLAGVTLILALTRGASRSGLPPSGFATFSPMLHGRSAETARIDELLAAARDGRSGALVIRGEAGVGKTALLDYAAAAAGMRVLRGTGIESEAELPFAALQLLLRPGLGRLDLLPPPQAQALRGAFGLAGTPGADRFLIGLAALSLLSELAGDGALLCVVDDTHWLDRASADALLFAARRLESEGVVLLISAREDGFEAPGLPELPLGRLGREASRALLAERAPGLPPGLADRVLAEADGNPLALLELPAALSESSGVPVALAASLELPAPLPLPRRLQQSYYRQAAALPAPTRTFLLVAAAEETGDLSLVRRAAQALGVPATAADAAERSGLIVVNAPAVAFRHPLVRAAVYQGATSAERGAAHAALAAALHDPMGGAPDADRHAWHQAAAAAGPDEGVAAALEQAADRARQRLGHAAAAAALERAARLTPTRPDRARRLIAAAGAALDAGRPDAASALAGQGQSQTAEPGALAEIARVRAWVAMERGEMHRVHELVVAGAGPIAGSDPLAAAALLRLGAVAGWWAGDAKLVQDAADRMTGLGRSELIPGPGALQAMADLLAGRPVAAVPRLAEVVAAARHLPPEQLAVRFYAANMALLIGDFDSARDLMLTTAQACRTQGVIRFLAPLSLGLSYANFCLTRFRAATESATEGLRLAQDTGQPVREAGLYSMLALLAAVGGDGPRCRELAASALRQFAAEEVANVSTMAEWALGLLDLGLGRYGAALNRFEMTATGALRHYIQPILFAPDQIEAAVRFGPANHEAPGVGASAADRAAEPLARFAAWARATGQPWARAVLHRCQALAGDGDPEEHYREALRQHAVSGRPFEHGRTELLYGEWLRRGRRGTDARAHLRAALTLFDRTGAAPWAERARAELRAAGEPAAAGAPVPDRLSLLTPQELQVVRLAASGATNRDIAAQLFISPRTVSHHLYRAFPKLGVTNRTALARLDLTGPDDLP